MPLYRPKFNGMPVIVNQVTSEIVGISEILKKNPPKRVLEVGTQRGGTLYVWTTVAAPEADIITIDLPNGYPEGMVGTFLAYGKPKKQKIHLVQGDSQTEETLEKVKKILNGELLDFLFIDADHSYKGAKRDFELYSTLVKDGGIIAFHDIRPANMFWKVDWTGEEFGVHLLWEEIKKKYEFKEIIENSQQNGFGLGVCYYKRGV